MNTRTRTPWIPIAIVGLLLTATSGAAQKTLSPEALYRRAVQKEVEGDIRAAVDLYQQVVGAAGVTPKVKSQAQEHLKVLTAPSTRPLTDRVICSESCAGVRMLASFSADGRYIATTNDDDELEIRDTVTGRVTRPVGGRDLSYGPWTLLSPDGQQVVYNFAAERDGNGRITRQTLKMVRADANARAQTVIDNPEYGDYIPGSWAPSGKEVLVAVAKPDRTWMLAWVSLADGQLKTIKSLGWRFQPMMGRPVLSPDGRYVAYAAAVSASANELSSAVHVYVLPLDGKSPEIELVSEASKNVWPVWMPDSRGVLFVSDVRGPWGLYSAALTDGIHWSRPTLVKPDTGSIRSVGVSKSGSYYYVASEARPAQFSIVDTSASATQHARRATRAPIVGFPPVWSPEGERLAFIRQAATGFGTSSGLMNTLVIYSLGSETEQSYRLDSNPASSVGLPIWLHDGKALIQPMGSGSDLSLFRVDASRDGLAGTEIARLASKLYGSALALSSDDRTIYALLNLPVNLASPNPSGGPANVNRIVAIDVRDGQQKDVATVSTSSAMLLSRDDKTVYLASCSNSLCDRIVALDVTTGEQRQILKLQNPESLDANYFALSPDGRTLAAASRDAESRSFRLFQVGVDGNGYRQLANLTPLSSDPYVGNQPGLSWSQDGTLFAASGSGLVRISRNASAPEVIKTVTSRYVKVSPNGSQMTVATGKDNIPVLHVLDNVEGFKAAK